MIVVSDNGASGEGGPNGSVNENKLFNGVPDDLQANLAMLDELGGPKTYNHYANGWAMAFNTPFKMWKRYEYNGGTADPCILSWPAGLGHGGEIRHQSIPGQGSAFSARLPLAEPPKPPATDADGPVATTSRATAA